MREVRFARKWVLLILHQRFAGVPGLAFSPIIAALQNRSVLNRKETEMKVLMLNGSFNPDGSTNAGLEIMAKTFAEEDVETEMEFTVDATGSMFFRTIVVEADNRCMRYWVSVAA